MPPALPPRRSLFSDHGCTKTDARPIPKSSGGHTHINFHAKSTCRAPRLPGSNPVGILLFVCVLDPPCLLSKLERACGGGEGAHHCALLDCPNELDRDAPRRIRNSQSPRGTPKTPRRLSRRMDWNMRRARRRLLLREYMPSSIWHRRPTRRWPPGFAARHFLFRHLRYIEEAQGICVRVAKSFLGDVWLVGRVFVLSWLVLLEAFPLGASEERGLTS